MIHLFDTTLPADTIDLVKEVLDSGYVNEGQMVQRFEDHLKFIFRFKNFLAVNSGTSALHLALKVAGIKSGDEVILPAQTFVATGMAILYCGGIPVFADIDSNGLISMESIVKKYTNKTKAVIMVDWGGLPCNVRYINEICHAMGLVTIEDAAQALGARIDQDYVGNHDSDFTCFSFQATKHLTTGDGGGLVCRSENDYRRAKELRWFGIDKEKDLPDATGERAYDLYEMGYKYSMNNVSAAIGLSQTANVLNKINKNIATAILYDGYLNKKRNIGYKAYGSYWFYPLLVNNRNTLIKTLYANGYESSVVHQGIDRNLLFGGLDRTLLNQRKFEEHFIALPINVTYDQVAEISKIVLDHERLMGKFVW